MTADAAASQRGSAVNRARPRPAAATTIDTNAAESSSRTVGSVGSRVSRTKRSSGIPRRWLAIECSATPSDIASNTNAPASTKNAAGEAAFSAGRMNLCTASQIENAPPSVKSMAETTNDQK